MNKHKILGLVIGGALIAGVFAILVIGGSRHAMPATTTTGAVATNQVVIKNYMFEPMVIKVKVGTKVTWLNQDAVRHTITADTTSPDAPSSMDIAQGKSFSFTFSKAGTYAYHCFPHPYMHGTVEVTE